MAYDRQIAQMLLDRATQKQSEYWEALAELEAEVGIEIDGTQDLEGIDLGTLEELGEEDGVAERFEVEVKEYPAIYLLDPIGVDGTLEANGTVFVYCSEDCRNTAIIERGVGAEGEKNSMKPVYIKAKTPMGTLSAELSTDPDYPGLTIYWNARQIAVVEPAKSVIRVMVWDNDEEDPSTVVPVFPGYGE